MKLNAVFQILKSRKRAMIFQGDQCQWLSDGVAAYPIYGLPEIKEENLKTLLDLNDKQWGEFIVRYDTPKFDESDTEPGEVPLVDLGLSICYQGKELIPLMGMKKIYYIQARYIKPFGTMDDVLFYAWYNEKGSCYIAVKEGMLLRGVTTLYDVADEEFADKLREIYNLTNNAVMDKRLMEQAEAEAEEMQNLRFEDSEV